MKNKKHFIALLLISGMMIHDFLRLPDIKIIDVTITYSRVALLVAMVAFLISGIKIKFTKVSAIFGIFMLYALTRISGNYRDFLNLFTMLLSFFFLYQCIDTKKEFMRCVRFSVIIFAVFLVYGYFEILSGIHFMDVTGDSSLRRIATGMYVNENDFSAFITIMIMITMISNYKLLTKLILSGLGVGIIVINKSHVCLLGILSFVLVYLLIRIYKRYKHNYVKLGLYYLIALVVIFIPGFFVLRTVAFGGSLWWRSIMYSYGFQNLSNHLLFGTGMGNYEAGMYSLGFVENDAMSANPHCLFLELGAEYGIIWTILLIIVLVVLSIEVLFYYFHTKGNKSLLSFFVFGLLYLIVFVSFASSSCMEKNYIYLGLLFPLVYLETKSKTHRKNNASI